MEAYNTSVLSEEMPEQLIRVLSAVDDVTIMQNFIRDVMTEKEIREIGARLEAAKMLTAGKSYVQIMNRTKLSSRTVARISDWLQNGPGGYREVLEMIEHLHTQPDAS